MTEEGFEQACERVLAEVGAVLGRLPTVQGEALAQAVASAPAVFVTGEGRSGLVGRCFAARLAHLGRPAHVVGETVTPAARTGDLLVAISGSGETPTTCLRAHEAARLGLRVAGITGNPKSTLAKLADLVLAIPVTTQASTQAPSVQFGGSLFEQCALLALDALILQLQRRLGETHEAMRGRHTTLE